METFGQRIKRLREARGLTQEQLAEACGYSGQSRIANYESGTRVPSARQIPTLARGLGVAQDELMDGERELPTHDQVSPDLVELRLALGATAQGLVETIPAAGDAILVALERVFGSPRTGTFARDLTNLVRNSRSGISRRSGNARGQQPRTRR